jgi:hypothetical protein
MDGRRGQLLAGQVVQKIPTPIASNIAAASQNLSIPASSCCSPCRATLTAGSNAWIFANHNADSGHHETVVDTDLSDSGGHAWKGTAMDH